MCLTILIINRRNASTHTALNGVPNEKNSFFCTTDDIFDPRKKTSPESCRLLLSSLISSLMIVMSTRR